MCNYLSMHSFTLTHTHANASMKLCNVHGGLQVDYCSFFWSQVRISFNLSGSNLARQSTVISIFYCVCVIVGKTFPILKCSTEFHCLILELSKKRTNTENKIRMRSYLIVVVICVHILTAFRIPNESNVDNLAKILGDASSLPLGWIDNKTPANQTADGMADRFNGISDIGNDTLEFNDANNNGSQINQSTHSNHTAQLSALVASSRDPVRGIIFRQRVKPEARSFFGLIIIPCEWHMRAGASVFRFCFVDCPFVHVYLLLGFSHVHRYRVLFRGQRLLAILSANVAVPSQRNGKKDFCIERWPCAAILSWKIQLSRDLLSTRWVSVSWDSGCFLS